MEQIQCVCTKCGHTMMKDRCDVYTPTEREALQKIKYFRTNCSACGHIMKLYYPCVYWNEGKQFVIFFTGGRMFESAKLEAEHLIKMKTDNMLARVCTTLEEFVEKVEILETDLDDRSMELFKLSLFARIHLQDPALQYIYFHRKDQQGQLEFTLISEQATRGISVAQDLYLEIEELMEKEAANEVEEGYMVIDREWAGNMIKSETGQQ